MAVDRIEIPITSFTIRSRDGLRLRVHQAGVGPHFWLLPPGMGTPLLVWKYILEAFHEKMTIVTWDQRGTYGSGRPDDLGDLAFERHVDDALAVLEALDWPLDKRFVTGSWSMGVEVGLMLFDQMPERIAGLTLLNGPFEHVLRTAYGPPILTPVTRAVIKGLIAGAPILQPLITTLTRQGWAGRVMNGLGLSTGNRDFVVAVTRKVADVDLAAYCQIPLEFDKHSARHVLKHVDVPTLITAGGKDMASPPAIVREMHRLIPGSDYVEIPTGTHYTLMEYPDEINGALERFFSTRVFPNTWTSASESPSNAGC